MKARGVNKAFILFSGIPRHNSVPPTRFIGACQQEASTSNGAPHEIINMDSHIRMTPQFPSAKAKRSMVRKLAQKPIIRSMVGKSKNVSKIHANV